MSGKMMDGVTVVASVILLSLMLVVAPAQAETLRAHFIGNEAFEITDGKVTLLTDFPYHSGAFGYTKPAQADGRQGLRASPTAWLLAPGGDPGADIIQELAGEGLREGERYA